MAKTVKPEGAEKAIENDELLGAPEKKDNETPAAKVEEVVAPETIDHSDEIADLKKQMAEFLEAQKVNAEKGEGVSEETIQALTDKIDKLEIALDKKEGAANKNQKFNPLTGQPIRPKYKEEELSKKMIHSTRFNKRARYNKGTKKEPISVNERADYLHFFHKNKQYTFWRDLPFTLEQIKALPKEYVTYMCSELVIEED